MYIKCTIYKNGEENSGVKFQVVVRTMTEEWAMSLPPPPLKAWIRFDLSWHAGEGLHLLQDNRLVGFSKIGTARTVTSVSRKTKSIFFGKATRPSKLNRFAKIAINGFQQLASGLATLIQDKVFGEGT